MKRSRMVFRFAARVAATLTLSMAVTLPGVSRLALANPEANVYVKLAKKVVPSVVNISTLTTVKGNGYPGMGDPFRQFFEEFFRFHGGRPPGRPGDDEDQDEGPQAAPPFPGGKQPKAMSLGTGFIIDSSGLILTNNHVVAGADEIKITFTEEADEKPTDGEVVGRDAELDVALIRVKTKREMKPLEFGDSDALEVGEYVAAVGNPFGQGHSVTHGIISAKGRSAPEFPLARYIQTDAPINPGNSGGPLVNLKGEVIAINNAIDQRAQGIGFAIPINAVKVILPQLKNKGVVTRGYIGVLVNPLSPEIARQIKAPADLVAPFVTHVYPGDPADKAGVQAYDVILEFDSKRIKSFSDLIAAVTLVPVGKTVAVKILRSGKETELKLTVTERPGPKADGRRGRPGKPGKKENKTAPKVETGMQLDDLTEEASRDLGLSRGQKGVVVSMVAYGSPADAAGLMRGDLIVEVDRKAIKSVEEFFSVVTSKKSYLLRVRRIDPQGRDSFTVIVLDLK
jgi:serine protease Do